MNRAYLIEDYQEAKGVLQIFNADLKIENLGAVLKKEVEIQKKTIKNLA